MLTYVFLKGDAGVNLKMVMEKIKQIAYLGFSD